MPKDGYYALWQAYVSPEVAYVWTAMRKGAACGANFLRLAIEQFTWIWNTRESPFSQKIHSLCAPCPGSPERPKTKGGMKSIHPSLLLQLLFITL